MAKYCILFKFLCQHTNLSNLDSFFYKFELPGSSPLFNSFFPTYCLWALSWTSKYTKVFREFARNNIPTLILRRIFVRILCSYSRRNNSCILYNIPVLTQRRIRTKRQVNMGGFVFATSLIQLIRIEGVFLCSSNI